MTCGECPFYDESVGWCNFTSSENVYTKMEECTPRKAYRVLRDEVRRLRRIMPKDSGYLTEEHQAWLRELNQKRVDK